MKKHYFLLSFIFLSNILMATQQLRSLPAYKGNYWMRVTPKGQIGKNTLFIVSQIIQNIDVFFSKKMATILKKSVKSISGTRQKSIEQFLTSMTPERQIKHQRGAHAMIDYLFNTTSIEDDIAQAKQAIDQIKDRHGNMIELSDQEKEFFVSFYLENCLRHNIDFIVEKYGATIKNIDNIDVCITLFHAFFEKIIQTTLSSTSDKNTKKNLLSLVILLQNIEKFGQEEKTRTLVQYVQNGFTFTEKFLTYLEEQPSEIDPEIKQKIMTHKRKLIALLKKIILQRPIFTNKLGSKKENLTEIIPGFTPSIGLPGLISTIKTNQQ